ncbi:MAG: nucleoside-triphosphatase [Firmicutes bacterium]|nr:nucleoside-triphosphatase [Bacillota bacterium]
MTPLLFVTGRPGVGKTTFVREVARGLGPGAAGFFTEEVRPVPGAPRTGFDLVTWPEGRRVALARVTGGQLAEGVRVGTGGGAGEGRALRSAGRVGRYLVYVEGLERVGLEALRRGEADAEVRLLVLDEIGRMECISPAFRAAVENLFRRRPKPLLATARGGRGAAEAGRATGGTVGSPGDAERLVAVLEALPGVEVLELTPANRGRMLREVLARFNPGRPTAP